MNKKLFSIADATFLVTANYDFSAQLLEPKAYNIHHNFIVTTVEEAPENIFAITLEDADVSPEIRIDNDGLLVRGRIATERGSEVERQNSLWGINGPVNKYIIHILETQFATATLHASALINPSGDKVCLAIGHSGSGKSVLVLGALKAGWKLLASEYVLARMNGTLHIHTGNYLDNMSIKAVDELRANLPQAIVMEDNFIKDPLMHKIFVDLSAYQPDINGIDIPPAALTVAMLNINNPAHRSGTPIEDDYFFTRSLQHIATEKVAMPLIVDRQMINTIPCGSAAARAAVIEAIVTQAGKRVILGGDANDFDTWLKDNA